MTRTGALLAKWEVSVAWGDLRPHSLALVLWRPNRESIERHQHRNGEAAAKCGSCSQELACPYDADDFPSDMTAERVLVAWLGDLPNLEKRYGHGRLLAWFGSDRFVDLCYAVAGDYGVGPFADDGEGESTRSRKSRATG